MLHFSLCKCLCLAFECKHLIYISTYAIQKGKKRIAGKRTHIVRFGVHSPYILASGVQGFSFFFFAVAVATKGGKSDMYAKP